MSDVSASRTGERRTQAPAQGRVALVGAGPGDPDLLTIKAARLIAEADVIFADRLVGKGILELAAVGAQIVPVGKSKGEHSVPQDEIQRRLVEAARDGKRVVRLKGGDPFIFGRGGEEVEALRAAGIEVEVVPGISAALGVAASAQIPLTHRDAAQAVTFVTGHAKLGEEPDLDWQALARANQTVVVFMGVGTAGTIAARLVAAGRDASTPVAVVENGTRSDEIRAFGVLGALSEIIQRAGIQGPALLIIGEVVALAKDARAFSQDALASSSPERGRGNGDNVATGAEWVGDSSLPDSRTDRPPPDLDGLDSSERGSSPARGRKESAPSLTDLWRMFS